MNELWITHLIELRKRFIFSLCGIALTTMLLIPYANLIYQTLANPLIKFLPSGAQLIATDILSPFTIPLKLTIMLAFLLSLPYTIWQIWSFVAPGLYSTERKMLFSLVASTFMMFITGIVFCYFAVLPVIFHFIGNFKAPQISMLTDITNYLNFVITMFSVFGIAFETPIVIFMLIKFNFLSIRQARKQRKFIFVACFIIAAILTPPDVLSQCLLAIPLYLLYELGILAAHFALNNISD